MSLQLFEMEYNRDKNGAVAQQENVKWAFGICNASPSFPLFVLTGHLSKFSKESESKIKEGSWHKALRQQLS